MGGGESGEGGKREGGMVKVREDVTVEVVLKSHAPKVHLVSEFGMYMYATYMYICSHVHDYSDT